MSRIRSIAVKEDYRLEVLLDNDSSITLNFKSRLGTVRFGMLADRAFSPPRPPTVPSFAGETWWEYPSVNSFSWPKNKTGGF